MQLRELISDFSYDVIKGNLDVEVKSFTSDSKRVSQGSMFVCIHGQEHDGHNFIQDALECQAAVLVTEQLSDFVISNIFNCSDITIIVVADTKKALALISARFYGNPANKMTMIGITGTKGKTTTAHMLQSIFQCIDGICCGLIGTNGWNYNGISGNLSHTTPPSFELHEILNRMYQGGCTHVIIEVSSIGVKEQRIYGIQFQYGIYTNLFCDHIGGKEHRDFEEYKYWKSQFFSQCEVGIFNQDDFYWHDMAIKCNGNVATYSLNQGEIANKSYFGTELLLKNQKQKIFVPLLGIANCLNALAAITCATYCGVDIRTIAEGMCKTVIKGRAELVCSGDGIFVFIDYAHNGESLRQILKTLRIYNPKRLICLFGCGGERSKERRYPMGMASGTFADLTVITEDNSRYESPEVIMEEIRCGVEDAGGAYKIIESRTEAIKWVITESRFGDVILLAGKGHESYIEKQGVKYPFSEYDIVMKYWNLKRGVLC